MASLAYQRILLKIAGDNFVKSSPYGIDLQQFDEICTKLVPLIDLGVELIVVLGGGNIFRGLSAHAQGMDHATADYMGMLATTINGLMLQERIEKLNIDTRLASSLEMDEVAEPYIRRRAIRHLEKKRIMLCVAGTGNPYFTTDTAAALRALELGADLLIKATRAEWDFDEDTSQRYMKNNYLRFTYLEALENRWNIMDATAVTLCRDNNLPIAVVNLVNENVLRNIIYGGLNGIWIH